MAQSIVALTTSTANLSHGTPAAAANGTFTVSVPADCVFTLTYSNSVSQRPPPDPPTLGYELPLEGNFRLNIIGTPLLQCAVDVSPNLVQWTNLTNVTLQDGTTQISAAMAAGSQFFRARALP